MEKKQPPGLFEIREKILSIFSKYSVPRWTVFLLDNLSVFLIFFFSYLLRFNFEVSFIDPRIALYQAIMTVAVYAVFSIIFRSYAELLRHTTLVDVFQVFLVTTTSVWLLVTISIFARLFHLGKPWLIPISILLIHYVSITVFLFAVRILIKIIFRFVTNTGKNRMNVLIYGAGELGFVVKRVVMSDPAYGFIVVGFIDNNKSYFGKTINGISVFNEDILKQDFIDKKNIESLILADPIISIEEKSRIVRKAINLGLEVLETPEVDKWLNGQIYAQKFQRVKIEDILGRDPIKLNLKRIKVGLNQKTILITGAAGSIGSEIVRQLARFNMKKVILVDQAETPLFYLENELKGKFFEIPFRVILADVTNRDKMKSIFNEHHPDIIFHAAAYKHVPLIEKNPHEAIRVNIGGTRTMIEMALDYEIEKFVMISTDKSVNPTSVMGASKRICELLVQSGSLMKGSKTQFIITRFGNVLGSNGSVIPLFTKQIREGGPVTVTHPDIIRYFMTIPEACQLVLEAGFMGKGGEIFVFDMGNPVKIADLAKSMIQLSGHIPGKEIEIKYTGLRPGEKLYEELLTAKEITLPTHHPKIKKAKVEAIDANKVKKVIDSLLLSLYLYKKKEILNIIKDLVPEFQQRIAKPIEEIIVEETEKKEQMKKKGRVK